MWSFMQFDSRCDSFAPDVHTESNNILLTFRLWGYVKLSQAPLITQDTHSYCSSTSSTLHVVHLKQIQHFSGKIILFFGGVIFSLPGHWQFWVIEFIWLPFSCFSCLSSQWNFYIGLVHKTELWETPLLISFLPNALPFITTHHHLSFLRNLTWLTALPLLPSL